MTERFKVTESVFVVACKGNEVLLGRRQNTGWLDGYYDLPSGHLDSEEEELKVGACRELKEETALVANPEDLKLFHISQNHMTPGNPYTFFMFKALAWSHMVLGYKEQLQVFRVCYQRS